MTIGLSDSYSLSYLNLVGDELLSKRLATLRTTHAVLSEVEVSENPPQFTENDLKYLGA